MIRPTLVVLLAALFAGSLTAQTKIAFVGLRHSHCWRQLQNVAKLDGVELAGVAEPEPELIAYAKTISPDTRYVSDYRKLIEDAKPDMVWAFVENNRHLEILEYLAPRGIHVIFEKPLASTYADAKRMRELATVNHIQVMTNYQMAWWPTNQEIKRQVDSGALGEVWRMHGIVGHGGPGSEGPRSKYFFAWLTDPVKNGAGALIDFGCYNALWALWFKGRPQTVFAEVNRLQPERFPKVEDNSVMLLGYQDGVGIFEGSWDLPHSFQQIELFGRQRSISMNQERVEMRAKRNGPAETIKPTPLPPERADPILYLADRIRTGKPVDNIMALDINVGAVEILEAAKESIRTGRPVRLPQATAVH